MSEKVTASDPYTAIALAGLELANAVVALFPDYEQKKVEDYHELREKFERERKKPYGLRNDKLVLDLGDELQRYVQDFAALLRSQGVEGLRSS